MILHGTCHMIPNDIHVVVVYIYESSGWNNVLAALSVMISNDST